jgi:hypothetical protein
MLIVRVLFIILTVSLVGCQQPFVMVSEQLVSPTAPPLNATPVVLASTQQSRDVATRELSPVPALPTAVSTPVQLGGPIILPTTAATATLQPNDILVGYSVQGRPITARRIGNGSRVLMLVGGIHGGWEENTVLLLNQLIAHFESHPEAILSDMSLVFVPLANPDGYALGKTEAGRFNANGVDLNRNWPCDWSAQAFWRSQNVNAGAEPFSEPETKALSAFILTLRPATVLFYHSAAGGVYAGECNGDHGSMLMSQILGQATGYSYGDSFSAYPVTGTESSWVDGLGIPSADVELFMQNDPEFDRNLAGVMALQEWLSQ